MPAPAIATTAWCASLTNSGQLGPVRLARAGLCPRGLFASPSLLFFVIVFMHASTSIPLADRVPLMVHPSVIRAFAAPNSVRLFQNDPPRGLPRRTWISGRQSSRPVAACMLVRAAGPSLPVLAAPTGPPVYGRACPSRGLPQPESAMTTRPNHPLPRQDLHLQACQRPKAALRSDMSKVEAVPKPEQAPLGAACRAPATDCSHVPLLAELEASFSLSDGRGRRFPGGTAERPR